MNRRYTPQQRPVNGMFWTIIATIYVALILLFGWQTYSFLDWLLPGDQFLMKMIGVFSLDGMALIWCCLTMWFSFSSRGAKLLVTSAWVITFVLALLASVEFMNIEYTLRFHVAVQGWMVQVGDMVSLFALVVNLLCIVFFTRMEWEALHPRRDMYEYHEALNDTTRIAAEHDEQKAAAVDGTTVHLPATDSVDVPLLPPAQHDSELDELRQQIAALTAQLSKQQSTRQSPPVKRQPVTQLSTPRDTKTLAYQRVKKLYEEGRNKTEIAEIVGVSRSTVIKWLKGA